MYKGFMISGFADEISPCLTEQISVLHKLGIHYMECRGVNGKPLIEYELPEVEKIKNQLDKANIKLSAVGSSIGKIDITDKFEPHFELFKHTVEVAKIMDTDNIRMFSFFMPKGKEIEKYQSEVFRRVEILLNYAVKHNIVLLHENEKDIYGDIALRCKEIMEKFYCKNFKGVFDFANFVQCGQDTIEAYKMLKPYIEYIHIKDALFKDGTVVPAGMGDGHVEEILAELRRKQYKGFLSLEPHLSDFTGFYDLEHGEEQRKTNISGEVAFTTAYNALVKLIEEMD